MNLVLIQKHFDNFKAAINQYHIEPLDTRNTNETGLRVDVGHDQWVLVLEDLDSKNPVA